MYSLNPPGPNAGCPRRARKTRWSPETQTAEISGLKTAITTPMTPEQIDAYAVRFRIEEISQKLRAGETAPASYSNRSPSPTPEYDASGRRTNTRQRRYRQLLEEERQALVGAAMNTNPGYQPPHDFRNFQRRLFTDKVYIPVFDFPGINFIGQILGPRGQSLKEMNDQSGANIAIRGKGSVKEGRAGHSRGHTNTSAATTDDQQEPLHCLIRADTQEKADHAKRLVNEVIEVAASTPEEQNQRKRGQLRRLAVSNGTFRDDEHQACENCGQNGHRRYSCPVPTRFVANVICYSCKSTGHVARDCPQKDTRFARLPPWRTDRSDRRAEAVGHDVEFEQLMSEIGN